MAQNETIQFANIIYYGSFLVFPFLLLLYYFHHLLPFWLLVGLLILAIAFVWSRFIETNIIKVNETTLPAGFSAKIALIADTHLGVYKDERFLARVVEKINQESVDYVLIAGDLTYAAKPEDLSRLFAPFKKLKPPVYAVLGNHDVEPPIQPLRDNMISVLKANNINILNNETVTLKDFTLVGLGDSWYEEDDITLLDNLSKEEKVVVLTHNPDTVMKYTNNNADFTLTGHTHGGQIRLPFLYKYMIPTNGNFDKGFSEETHTKLFITCGLGEVGLPMRLFNPPVIDILHFTAS